MDASTPESCGTRWTRHEFDRRGSRPRSQHDIQDVAGVSAVFGPVGSVDLVVDVVSGVDECDILLNAAGPYPTFVPLLGTAEPLSAPPPHGSDVQVIAVTDDPHGHRFSQLVVAPDCSDLEFFISSHLLEHVAFPLRQHTRPYDLYQCHFTHDLLH